MTCPHYKAASGAPQAASCQWHEINFQRRCRPLNGKHAQSANLLKKAKFQTQTLQEWEAAQSQKTPYRGGDAGATGAAGVGALGCTGGLAGGVATGALAQFPVGPFF